MYEMNRPNEEEIDLTVADLLGVINMLSDSNNRLTGIMREYQSMAASYAHKCAVLRDERDRARALAVTLEQECAACWGPVHSQTIEAAKLAMVLWGENDGA
jgi:hypothetical protein